MEMDALIRSAFPPDLLLYQVLPRLPLLHRLRLRPVCRKWSTLLFSQSYIEHCSATSASSFLALFDRKVASAQCPDDMGFLVVYGRLINSWLDLRKKKFRLQVFLYDHFENSWHPLSRPLIPHELPHRVNMNGYVPIASAGGLLCFQDLHNGDSDRLKLVVCNPVLNEWMDIPEIVWKSSYNVACLDHFSLCPKREGPGFFLALAIEGEVLPFVFDSATNCWMQVPTAGLPFRRFCFTRVLIIQGIAYFLASYVWNPLAEFLIRYDIVQQQTNLCCPVSTEKCSGPTCGGFLRPELFELYGQPMRIRYGVGYHQTKQLDMLVYNTATSEWNLLKYIPGPPWDEKKYIKDQKFGIFQSHNFLYFYRYSLECDHSCDPNDCECHEINCEEEFLAYKHFDKGCDIFDVETSQWKRMAEGPYEGVGRRITTFVPTHHSILETAFRKRKCALN